MCVFVVGILWRRDAVIRHQMLVRQLIAPLGVSASATVMNTRPRPFCQKAWGMKSTDDAVEIGCHLEVSPQCFSSRWLRS